MEPTNGQMIWFWLVFMCNVALATSAVYLWTGVSL